MQFRDNFERRQKANLTLLDKVQQQMQDVMIEYKTEYNLERREYAGLSGV